MGDLPLKPGEEKKSDGLQLQFGNIEIITVKLLESVQNLLIENNKILRAIAIKQGAVKEETPNG